MKVLREAIQPDSNSSFKILLTPNLNDLFYWHFHPEYEMVYVEAASGIRHIGDHISRYSESDLVFIGPYIPHLNFDYGVHTECEEVVVQMKEHFLGPHFFTLPEMEPINKLFQKSHQGIAFHGRTKEEVGMKLKRLSNLSHFEQLLELLQIFQRLAISDEYTLLGSKPMAAASLFKEGQRMQQIHRYIERHYAEPVNVAAIAALCHLTTAAFCRYFKRATRLTFTDFLNQYRINQAKKLLLHDKNVTEACFECGFENLSHFNKTFKKWTGENPSSFKKRHAATLY